MKGRPLAPPGSHPWLREFIRLGARIVVAVLLAALVGSVPAAAARSRERSPRPCQAGIELAFSGEETRAESMFVALLSVYPASALNDLGNLHLWRGEHDVAIEFYRAAGQIDSADAGIFLNAATALMMSGDPNAARVMADDAVRRAGGIEAASGLLGVPFEKPAAGKEPPAMLARGRRDQSLHLVRAAMRGYPEDSTLVRAPADSVRTPTIRRVPVRRPAGAGRAASPPPIVYWKR